MKPQVIVCDIDGTIALRTSDRSPYDMDRVREDTVNIAVATVIKVMHDAGWTIVFTSGRDETARYNTAAWIEEHIGIVGFDLMLRDTGDLRDDAVIKKEMLDIITSFYRILVVFDDRNRVVDMWHANGVECWQVCSREKGNF